MARYPTCHVRFTEHAKERLEQYNSEQITPQMVRHKLMGMLPMGMEVRNLAVEVPIKGRLHAVCVPGELGGWTVVTFCRKGEVG